MRIARPLGLLLAILTAATLLAPSAGADRPFRLQDYVTDSAGVLDGPERAAVSNAVDTLYNENRTRLWVVYVDSFSGSSPVNWAQDTMNSSGFGDGDALLAIAVQDRAYSFLVPSAITSDSKANDLRRNDIEPKLRIGDWSGAAIAAADGLRTEASGSGTGVSWVAFAIALAIIAVVLVVLLLIVRRRRRRRRTAEFEAAKRVDATDPAALAALSLDALDDLSKSIVVEVDNAVRTSESELALAVEEFGPGQTEPFIRAVAAAKNTLAQAFNARQILDDAVPESAQQRRDLLTRVIVAAARADRELDTQSEAFAQLRDLVINAPTRLDALTQQMVDVYARIEPSARTLAALHSQFADGALVSVAGNVETAKQRLTFADQHLSNGRNLVARPAGDQFGLVEAIRAAESGLGQARTLLDAVDSASTDINRAMAALPAAIADIQRGIEAAGAQLRQPGSQQGAALSSARDAAIEAVADANAKGGTDPLGTFTRLTKADADLDQLLASVAEEREAAQRLARSFEQALFTAQSRVKSVSDFIDTRRGSIGPEARTRLAEALRQLEAAQAKRSNNVAEAIAHANGAAMLAAQAQTLANADVQAAQRSYTGRYGGGGGGSNMGAVIGGIVIGNILSGAMRGGFSGGFGGGWSPGSFGGSGGSSGGYSGGGGRF